MSRFIDWSVWNWDIPTAWNVFLVLQFLVLEYLTSHASPIQSWQGNMVTDHWRPVFHAQPLTWWLAFGAWLWLGPHFLFPALEAALKKVVGA